MNKSEIRIEKSRLSMERIALLFTFVTIAIAIAQFWMQAHQERLRRRAELEEKKNIAK